MTDQLESPHHRRVSVLSHQVAALLFFGCGLFVIWKALSFQYLTPIGPGPGFFPLWIGVALVLLSITLLGQSLAEAVPLLDDPFIPSRQGINQIAATLITLVAFVWAVERIGFTITTVLFSLTLFRVYGSVSFALSVVCAIMTGPLLYYVFYQILGVRLPSSPLALWPLFGV